MHLIPLVARCCASHQRMTSHQAFPHYWRKGHRLFDESVKQQPSGSGCAAVKAKGELVEIVIQMICPARSLVGSEQPALEQGDHLVDAGQQIIWIAALSHNAVPVASGFQTPVTPPAVSLNFGPWLDHLLHGLSEAFPRSVSNAGKADSSDLSSVNLSAHKDQALACCSSPSFAGFGSADKGFVDFHDPRQSISTRPHHGATQLVQPVPGGPIASQAQGPLQPQCTDSILLVGHMPHRLKPHAEGFMRIGEKGSGSGRKIMSAARAAIKGFLHLPRLSRLTPRALNSLRPSRPNQICPAVLLAGEPIMKFHHRLRVIRHSSKRYPLGSGESSA